MEKFKSREQLFRFFEEYSGNRRKEIADSKTSKPLLKTYIIETFRPIDNKVPSEQVFKEIPGITLSHQLDESLYAFQLAKVSGYLEKMNDRFWLLYSVDRSTDLDGLVDKLVRQSSLLDHVWISGKLFNVFWNQLLGGHDSHRFIRMSFEYDDLFFPKPKKQHGHPRQENPFVEDLDEKKISRFLLTEQKAVVDNLIPRLQNLLPSFYVTSSLRFPSNLGSGGHDFYYLGKVTNRSDSFRDHRLQVLSVCRVYERITTAIEDEVWFGVEKNSFTVDKHHYSLKGTPVTIMFSEEIPEEKFENFIIQTFIKNRGPFRLWGQPIQLGKSLVHVYGVDMHLWQELYLEMSPKQFILILPEGTCGNSVHRMVTNIQRYLEPQIKVFIGEHDYDVLSSRVAGEAEVNDSTNY